MLCEWRREMLCEWKRVMNNTDVFPKEGFCKKSVGFVCVKGVE